MIIKLAFGSLTIKNNTVALGPLQAPPQVNKYLPFF